MEGSLELFNLLVGIASTIKYSTFNSSPFFKAKRTLRFSLALAKSA